MAAILSRIVKWVVYTGATGLIVLALLVGVARLLLPLVPEYQDEIRRWASEATGFTVDFGNLTASWPLAGPELHLFDVSIAQRDSPATILHANDLTVSVSLLRLIRDREITLSRLTVNRASLDIRREADGSFRIQGIPASEFLERRGPSPDMNIPEIQIGAENIDVRYFDVARPGETMDLFVDRLRVLLTDETLQVDGQVDLDARLGRQVELALELPSTVLTGGAPSDDASPEWTVYAAGQDLELDQLIGLWPALDVPLVAGRGDVLLWTRFAGRQPLSATADIDLQTVELAIGPGWDPAQYQALAGRFEWEKKPDGWVGAASKLRLTRDGRSWPRGEFSIALGGDAGAGSRRVTAQANFLRLQDLYPMLLAVATEDARANLLPRSVTGDLRDLDLVVNLEPQAAPRYELDMRFDGLGLDSFAGGPSLSGLSGYVVADENGGRLEIDTVVAGLMVPDLFAREVRADLLEGFLVWRVTDRQVRILSDDIRITTPYLDASSRFELSIPLNGDSPFIDLTAVARSEDIGEGVQYLPLEQYPGMARWMRRAVVSGRMPEARIAMRGDLAAFPYDEGDGHFRIDLDLEDAVLDYADRWPRVENMDAHLVLDGASLSTTENGATIVGIPVQGRDVRVPDLRRAVLEVSGAETFTLDQLLTFLRATPVADALGPVLFRVSGGGEVDGELSLRMPVTRPEDYDLNAVLFARGCDVNLEGLGFGFSQVQGELNLHNSELSADNLQARLLDEPVQINLRPAEESGGLYGHFAGISGTTPAPKWVEALHLPFGEYVSGSFQWTAMALIPGEHGEDAPPLHILARSELVGMESKMPAPLAKHPGTAELLEVDIAVSGDDELEVTGRLRRDISWALRLTAAEDTYEIERGAIHAGSAGAVLPVMPGVEFSGRLARFNLADWLALADTGRPGRWTELYRGAVFDVDRLNIFGQIFPAVELEAHRHETHWRVDVDGPNAVGSVIVPLELDGSEPLVLDMGRLWLLETDPAPQETIDPRDVLPAIVSVGDFAMGTMQFGSLSTDIRRSPDGVVANPIHMESGSFTIDGDGAWLVEAGAPDAQRSSLRLDLTSNDIKQTLMGLGYDPLIEGNVAEAHLDISWPGPPAEDFAQRSSGDFQVRMKDGALVDLEPGRGRLLGVLSVAALPRRLALDFRDVFDEGLSFNTLQGDFNLDSGNAYTCNLGLEGSVADMGIVGRAGIRDEDYDQLAVVRPHVSNVLALGGAVVGGPGVGAAMLLISQIFRKPLSAFGESYYRVAGTWDEPLVERMQRSEVDATPYRNCEQYLAQVLPVIPDIAEAAEELPGDDSSEVLPQ